MNCLDSLLSSVGGRISSGGVRCVAVIGSGGKSTLLRCINLLEEADSGHIWFDGQDLMDLKIARDAATSGRPSSGFC